MKRSHRKRKKKKKKKNIVLCTFEASLKVDLSGTKRKERMLAKEKSISL